MTAVRVSITNDIARDGRAIKELKKEFDLGNERDKEGERREKKNNFIFDRQLMECFTV